MQQRVLVMLIEVERLAVPPFRIGRIAAGITYEAEQEARVRRGTVLPQVDVAAIGGFLEASLIRELPRFFELDGPIDLSRRW